LNDAARRDQNLPPGFFWIRGPGTQLSVRWVFSARGLDALQDRKAQEHNGAHCDPVRGDMQDHGSIDEPADQYQEADKVETEVPAGCDVQVLPSGRQELLQAQEM